MFKCCFWFFTHWSAATALVEKDEADSCHSWPEYNALPGRVKGCYSFRYPNKVQLRFWLIQIFFGSLILEKSMYPHYARCTVNRLYDIFTFSWNIKNKWRFSTKILFFTKVIPALGVRSNKRVLRQPSKIWLRRQENHVFNFGRPR